MTTVNDPRALRNAFGAFLTGVTVVTTTDDRFVEVPGLRPVHPAT